MTVDAPGVAHQVSASPTAVIFARRRCAGLTPAMGTPLVP
jgi:hypothetical protein